MAPNRPHEHARRPPSSRDQSINRRLAQIRERLEGPRGKLRFARKIGESHSNLSRYERGRTVPAHVLARVVKAYGVSARWLLTGRGRALEPTPAEEIRALHVVPPSPQAEQPSAGTAARPGPFHVLPVLRRLSALAPGHRVSDDEVEGPAVVHTGWCPHPSRTDLVRYDGDGMEPLLPRGAVLAVDRTCTRPEASVGKVVALYIARTGEVTVARLRRDGADPRRYMALPEKVSPHSQPHVLEEGDRVIGRVVGMFAPLP